MSAFNLGLQQNDLTMAKAMQSHTDGQYTIDEFQP